MCLLVGKIEMKKTYSSVIPREDKQNQKIPDDLCIKVVGIFWVATIFFYILL